MIIAKNSTQETLTIQITSSRTVDVGIFDKVNLLSYFSRSELAQAKDLMNKIKDGFIILNDGAKDLDWLEAIDILKDFQDKTEKDATGKWIVRSDSRRSDYDIYFTGSGDDMENREIGDGPLIFMDFSGSPYSHGTYVDAPTGYKRKRVEFQFLDGAYLKDGTIKYTGAPPGSYMDMYVVCPEGYYFDKKWVDDNGNVGWTYHESHGEEVFAHWVNKYFLFGANQAETLGTETSSDTLAPEYLKWRIEVTVPDNPNLPINGLYIGVILQIYRARTVIWHPGD